MSYLWIFRDARGTCQCHYYYIIDILHQFQVLQSFRLLSCPGLELEKFMSISVVFRPRKAVYLLQSSHMSILGDAEWLVTLYPVATPVTALSSFWSFYIFKERPFQMGKPWISLGWKLLKGPPYFGRPRMEPTASQMLCSIAYNVTPDIQSTITLT